MEADSILFDLDGTLWDSMEGILLTWNRVIHRYPGLRPPITQQEQQRLMGLQMDEIARRLFPNEPADRQLSLMAECEAEENEYFYHHGGKLYPQVSTTLERLHRKHRLFVVSNCQQGYIDAFLHAHNLSDCFDGNISFGDTGLSKGENIRLLMRWHELRNPVYVGDTQSDLDSADFAGIPFVFAAYGFGSVTHCTAEVPDFQSLLELFP